MVGLLIALLFTLFLLFNAAPESKNIYSDDASDGTNNDNEGPKMIYVDIGGAVANPGLYGFEEGARLNDVLVQAGPFLDNVSFDWVSKQLNLAEPVKDHQKIYIPFDFDIQAECSGTVVIDEIVFTPQIDNSSRNSNNERISVTPVVDASDDGDPRFVNVNTASVEELDKLPGIGDVYAGRIVLNRPYANLEDLKTKADLSDSVVSKISSLVVF